MDANTPNPALLRAYPYLAHSQLQPSQPAPTSSPDTNACERLIQLARSMRTRPVYEIQRIGGEDHLPLFRAYLLLTPQNYSAQGMGRSKMAARRDAACNMINLITEKALGGQPPVADTGAQLLPTPPKVEVKEEPAGHEMEEGELASDGPDDKEQGMFFVDREPDPELEKEAQDERLLEEGSSVRNPPEHTDTDQGSQQNGLPPAKRQEIPAGKTASDFPAPQPDETLASTQQADKVLGLVAEEEEEARQVPKRARTQLDHQPAPVPRQAPVNELGYVIPPRKRAKSIPRDFPMRLRIWIFCNYTEDVVKSLKALAEANLFVDLSICMFSTVELPKYVLLGKSVAAEVTVLPEGMRKSPTALIGTLAFAVGAKSEEAWVERAKHLASGYPMGLSPRTLVLHDDPSLGAIKVKNVIDVMRPTEDLVQYITRVLERAKDGMATAT